MPTLLCVAIMVHNADAALADAAAARLAGAELVEFRVDECFTGAGDEAGEALVERIVRASPLPCIVTCRSKDEGGGYEGDESARIALFERLCVQSGDSSPRYIDVEYSSFAKSAAIRQKVKLAVDHPERARDAATGLILSLHDFDRRPPDLMRRASAMASEHSAAVIKFAYRARSLRDSLEVLELPALTGKPTIALAMGEFGLISRVLAPKFGGFLTFAGLRSMSTTAPGQPTISDLLGTYRMRSIGPATGVYGVVGWPLTHSLSPLVHNAGFERCGVDAVYLPLPVVGDDSADGESAYLSFKATLLELLHHPRLSFRGCSVTLPHKRNLVRLAKEQRWTLEDSARIVGAANTLVASRGPADDFTGAVVQDTDGPAAVASVEATVGSLRGRSVALIGAGGVARTVAYAIATAGAAVTVYNRTRRNADRMVQEIKESAANAQSPAALASITAGDQDSMATSDFDVIINCTPMGMKGSGQETQVAAPVAELTGRGRHPVVMDTVYNPIETPVLKQARSLGLTTIDGATMFVRQAARQFESWTGLRPPAELFDRLVREKLAGQVRDSASSG